MKRYVLLAGLGVFLGLPAQAQNDYPRFELFGGYAFAHTDLSTGFTPALNGHGWAASLSANFHKQFGLTTDFSGHYRRIGNPSFRCLVIFPPPPECSQRVKASTFQVLFGPRLTLRYQRLTFFGHLLAGAVETRIGSYTEPGFMFGETTVPQFDVPARSQADFAMGFGLGIDVRASDRWAARLFQGDYIPVCGGACSGLTTFACAPVLSSNSPRTRAGQLLPTLTQESERKWHGGDTHAQHNFKLDRFSAFAALVMNSARARRSGGLERGGSRGFRCPLLLAAADSLGGLPRLRQFLNVRPPPRRPLDTP